MITVQHFAQDDRIHFKEALSLVKAGFKVTIIHSTETQFLVNSSGDVLNSKGEESVMIDGIEMNDSQIRSTLNKVRKTSEGGKPQIPNTSPREKALAGLHGDLLKVRAGFMSEDSQGNREPLPTKAWTLCIRTIEDSIQRFATGSGSRGYQSFLEGFIAKGL